MAIKFRDIPIQALVVMAILTLFAVLVATGIHGFSMGSWRGVLDSDIPAKPRFTKHYSAGRSDDTVVYFPQVGAQAMHQPPFPEINESIGNGQNMLVSASGLAVGGPLGFFRSGSWGFQLIDLDHGLSWLWWFRVLGIWLAGYLLFDWLAKGRAWVGAGVATFYTLSSYFHRWTFAGGEVSVFGLASIYALLQLVFCRTKTSLILWTFLLAYTGASFSQVIYPPWQLTYVWAGLGILFFAVLRFHDEQIFKPESSIVPTLRWKILGIGLAVGFTLIPTAYLFWRSHDVFEIMAHTVYPGIRNPTGGDLELLPFFSNYFDMQTYPTYLGGGAFGFYLVLPLLIPWMAVDFFSKNSKLFRHWLPAIVILTLIFIWAFFGLPASVAKMFFLPQMPGYRSHFFFGLLNAAFLATWLGEVRPRVEKLKSLWSIKLIFTFFFFAALWAFKNFFTQNSWNFSKGHPSYFIAGAVLIFLLLQLRSRLALIPLLAISIHLISGANPLDIGGFSDIYAHPLSKKIQELDANLGGHSKWVVFKDWVSSNLPRMLGVNSINGVNFHPQFDLWKVIDPRGEHTFNYNRYAHVIFFLEKNPAAIGFASELADNFVVTISPLNSAFCTWGVTHYLVNDANTAQDFRALGMNGIYTYKNFEIFERGRGCQ